MTSMSLKLKYSGENPTPSRLEASLESIKDRHAFPEKSSTKKKGELQSIVHVLTFRERCASRV